MAFPDIFDPTEPNPNAVVATDVSKITQNFQTLSDVLGLPTNPTAITGAAFTISPNGQVAIAQGGATIPVDPTAGSSIANRQYVDSFVQISNNGSGSAFTATYPGIVAYQQGHRYAFFCLNNANGNDTLSINSLAAIPLYKCIPGVGNVRTVANDFLANQTIEAIFDGFNFQMIGFVGVNHGFTIVGTVGNGNFIVPVGITSLVVDLYGAGGGGGASSVTGGGGGGGGGAHVKLALTGLTPGSTIPYSVGAAGGGGVNAPGTAGGATTFLDPIGGNQSAFGGSGGAAGAGSGGAGGAGGIAQVAGIGEQLTWVQNEAGLGGTNGSGSGNAAGGANFRAGGAGGAIGGNPGAAGTNGYLIVWY